MKPKFFARGSFEIMENGTRRPRAFAAWSNDVADLPKWMRMREGHLANGEFLVSKGGSFILINFAMNGTTGAINETSVRRFRRLIGTTEIEWEVERHPSYDGAVQTFDEFVELVNTLEEA